MFRKLLTAPSFCISDLVNELNVSLPTLSSKTADMRMTHIDDNNNGASYRPHLGHQNCELWQQEAKCDPPSLV